MAWTPYLELSLEVPPLKMSRLSFWLTRIWWQNDVLESTKRSFSKRAIKGKAYRFWTEHGWRSRSNFNVTTGGAQDEATSAMTLNTRIPSAFSSLNPSSPPFIPAPRHLLTPKEYERGCIKISSFNSRSIRHKIHELNNYLQNTVVSILAVSETWLGPSIPDCMVTIPGFQPPLPRDGMEEVFVFTFTITSLMSAGMIWKTVNWN